MVYDGSFKKISKVYLTVIESVPVEDYDDAIEDKMNHVVDKFKEIKHMKYDPKKFADCIKKKIMDVKK